MNHEKLFSGEIKTLPFSPSRLWRFSTEIFAHKGFGKAKSPFGYVTSERGIRDYAALSLADQSTVQMTMIVADSFLADREKRGDFKDFAEEKVGARGEGSCGGDQAGAYSGDRTLPEQGRAGKVSHLSKTEYQNRRKPRRIQNDHQSDVPESGVDLPDGIRPGRGGRAWSPASVNGRARPCNRLCLDGS